MPGWQNSRNYAPRYRGQLNAQFPSALRPREILYWAVHGTSWHSFDYSPNRHEITVYYYTKHPWNNCFITQRSLKLTMFFSPINRLLHWRARSVSVISHWIVKNYTNRVSHCVYVVTSQAWYSIQLFYACLVNCQNYAPRCRGQLNAVFTEAARQRAIVHWAVHGTEGHGFDYSTK